MFYDALGMDSSMFFDTLSAWGEGLPNGAREIPHNILTKNLMHELTIYGLDYYQNKTLFNHLSYFRLANWHAITVGPTSKPVSKVLLELHNLDDLINKVIEQVGECKKTKGEGCCCIKNLYLIGHGSPQTISVGGGVDASLDEVVTYSNYERLLPLKEMFCENARMVFWGCNVADDNGKLFLKQISEDLHIETIGFDSKVFPGRTFGTKWRYKYGEELPSETSMFSAREELK